MSPEQRDHLLFLMTRPGWITASRSEDEGADDSFEELKRSGGLGDLPLVVLSAGQFWPNGDFNDEKALGMRRVWLEQIQPALPKLSTRSKHVIVDSGHQIPLEAPGAVVQAVSDVIAMGSGPASEQEKP